MCVCVCVRGELTWLSHDVATRRLALGLKDRLDTPSVGGDATWNCENRRGGKKNG